MNLEKLKDELKTFLKKEGLKLYDVTYQKSESILTVMLDETLDLNKIEDVSNKISEYMDKIDEDMDKYILDVTTVGAERPIKSSKEVNEAINEYVYVKTKDVELTGTLVSYENDVLTIEYKDKTRNKKASINYKDVKQMRYAIKF